MVRVSIPVLQLTAAAVLTVGGMSGLGLRAEHVAQAPAAQAPAGSATSTIDPLVLKALQWRSIGPDRGGRSIAVSGVKGRPKEAYFGAVGGGCGRRPTAARPGRR